jgi:hypothetical protein
MNLAAVPVEVSSSFQDSAAKAPRSFRNKGETGESAQRGDDMSKRILALGASAFLAMAPAVSAATIDTYDFTQGGYSTPVAPPFDTGVLAGSFTGSVEADGFIELADVSSMTVKFAVSGTPIWSIDSLPVFFSFDTTGGSSSLDFITNVAGVIIPACVGAAAALGAGGCGSGGVNGIVGETTILGVVVWTTQDLPVVTLVSSVTSIPEPSTWVMMLLGFAGLGYVGYRSRQAASVAA